MSEVSSQSKKVNMVQFMTANADKYKQVPQWSARQIQYGLRLPKNILPSRFAFAFANEKQTRLLFQKLTNEKDSLVNNNLEIFEEAEIDETCQQLESILLNNVFIYENKFRYKIEKYIIRTFFNNMKKLYIDTGDECLVDNAYRDAQGLVPAKFFIDSAFYIGSQLHGIMCYKRQETMIQLNNQLRKNRNQENQNFVGRINANEDDKQIKNYFDMIYEIASYCTVKGVEIGCLTDFDTCVFVEVCPLSTQLNSKMQVTIYDPIDFNVIFGKNQGFRMLRIFLSLFKVFGTYKNQFQPRYIRTNSNDDKKENSNNDNENSSTHNGHHTYNDSISNNGHHKYNDSISNYGHSSNNNDNNDDFYI